MGLVEQVAASQREQQRLQEEAAVGRQALADQKRAQQWQQLNQAKELGMAEVLNGLRAQQFAAPVVPYPNAPQQYMYENQVAGYGNVDNDLAYRNSGAFGTNKDVGLADVLGKQR